MMSKPAAGMSSAIEGGAWNAKQFGELPHFDSGRAESVSSRFPKARSAPRRGPTTGAIERRPPSGGMPYFDATTVSPTHAIVTLRAARSGVVAVAVAVVAAVLGGDAVVASVALSVN